MGYLYFILESTVSNSDSTPLASFWFNGMLSYPNLGISSYSVLFTSFAYSFLYINFYDCADKSYPFKIFN
jgi:hypothetical protein